MESTKSSSYFGQWRLIDTIIDQLLLDLYLFGLVSLSDKLLKTMYTTIFKLCAEPDDVLQIDWNEVKREQKKFTRIIESLTSKYFHLNSIFAFTITVRLINNNNRSTCVSVYLTRDGVLFRSLFLLLMVLLLLLFVAVICLFYR